MVSPEGPSRPVSGCIAGAGLLAGVTVSKFADRIQRYIGSRISRPVMDSICPAVPSAIGSATWLTC